MGFEAATGTGEDDVATCGAALGCTGVRIAGGSDALADELCCTGDRIAGGSDALEDEEAWTGERIAGGSDDEDAFAGA